ncbi:transposase [Ekhidna sp.]|uniref:transposase n=1 Tax=Ekhidna sp. TaxID=2608089 RepID=UPI003BADB2B3
MQPEKIYFYTASILDWHQVLSEREVKKIIIDSLEFLVKDKSVAVSAFVIMPNHIHIIWKPLRQNLKLRFMKFTAQKIKFWLVDNNSHYLEKLIVNKKDRTYQVWQRNTLATELYTPKVIEQKLDYIHNNPCQGKWMLADDPTSYPWSSASFYEADDETFSFLTDYRAFI